MERSLSVTSKLDWHKGGLSSGEDVTWTPEGDIVVCDSERCDVLRLSSDGRLLTRARAAGVWFDNSPCGITYDSHESAIIVSEATSILLFLHADDLTFIKKLRISDVDWIRGVAVLSDGTLVLGTLSPDTISLYDRAGERLKCITHYGKSLRYAVSAPCYISVVKAYATHDVIIASMRDNNHLVSMLPNGDTLAETTIPKPGGNTVTHKKDILVSSWNSQTESGAIYRLHDPIKLENKKLLMKFSNTGSSDCNNNQLLSVAVRDNCLAVLFNNELFHYTLVKHASLDRIKWIWRGIRLGCSADVTWTDTGDIIVINKYDCKVFKFSQTGNLINSSKVSQQIGDQSMRAWGVTFDPYIPAIIIAAGMHGLLFINPDNLLMNSRLELEEGGTASCVGVMSDGSLVVGTWDPGTISTYDRRGNLLRCITRYGEDPVYSVTSPASLTILPDDTVVVSMWCTQQYHDHVVYLSRDGHCLHVVPVCNPSGLALDPQGNVHVVGRKPENYFGFINTNGNSIAMHDDIDQLDDTNFGEIRSIANRNNELAVLFKRALILFEWIV